MTKQTAYFKVKGKADFEVKILKEEMKFGRKHYTIKPVAGKGEFMTWKLEIK